MVKPSDLKNILQCPGIQNENQKQNLKDLFQTVKMPNIKQN